MNKQNLIPTFTYPVMIGLDKYKVISDNLNPSEIKDKRFPILKQSEIEKIQKGINSSMVV